MAIVYLEELTEKVPNKYLAVNVIAKRARSINDELLGAGLSQKQKPVSEATDDLASGKLSYKQLDPDTPASANQSVFTLESEGNDVADEENPLAEIYGESATEEGDEEEPTVEVTDENQQEPDDASDVVAEQTAEDQDSFDNDK